MHATGDSLNFIFPVNRHDLPKVNIKLGITGSGFKAYMKYGSEMEPYELGHFHAVLGLIMKWNRPFSPLNIYKIELERKKVLY